MSNKIIAITGVSKGLGRAMTERFIDSGHTVVGCARSDAVIRDLNSQYGSPHQFDAIDVGDPKQVQQWAALVLAKIGPPEILINCAAIINNNAPLWEVSSDEFSQLVDINIKGVHNTIVHFVPAMIEHGKGVIVNFSSYWGRSTAPDVAAYCATKWAIEGLSRGLADDLPTGLASVALNPGVIHTEMLANCFGSGAASYPNPQQWASAAVPFILGFQPQNNGDSVTVPGY